MFKNKTNKKRIKNIVLIILTLILFIGKTSVNAKENDSTLIRNKQDNIFAVAPLSDRTHLYYLEMYSINNIPTYCIEIGKSITTTTYNSTDNLDEQKRITKLTEAQLNYINLVTYFGYLYEENGVKLHKEKEYYMATQEIIWEYLNNINITWTNEEDINGKKLNIDNYINEIKNLIIEYNNSINIPSQINIQVGDNISYNSSNLKLYKIANYNDIIGNINNNKLEISAPNNYIGPAQITLNINNYTNNPRIIYSKDNSQILLSKGYIQSKTKEININIEGKKLNINLVDKDTKKPNPQGQATLEGAKYELYDKNNNLITTFTFDDTLQHTVNNLYNDKYYIKQIEASEGYKINEDIVEIDLSKNNSITLEEEVIKCKFEVIKFYEVDNKLEREENIEFSFNYYDKTTGYFGSIITTKQGRNIITLPYGKYKVIQENTTYGYEKAPILRFIVDKERENPYNYTVINKQIKTKLNIITLDKENNNEIKDNQITYKIKDSNGNYLSYNSTNIFTTNENGQLLLPFTIPYGIYYIEQVKSPTNYLKNEEIKEITINDKTKYINNNNELLVNVNYYNIKGKGSITIITNKEETIDGKQITTKRDNIEIEVYKDNVLLGTYQTNKEGIYILENIELGVYCIKEKNTKECLELTEDDNNKKVTLTEKIIKNSIKTNYNTKKINIPNTLSNKPDLLRYIKIIFIIIGVILYKKITNYINNNNNNNTTPKRKSNSN